MKPIEPNYGIDFDSDKPLNDPYSYQRLIDKLIYMTITRPDIRYPISVVTNICMLQKSGTQMLLIVF